MGDSKFINPTLSYSNVDLYFHRRKIFDFISNRVCLTHGSLLDAGCGEMPYKSYILMNSKISEYVGLDIETALNYNDEVKPDFEWDGVTMPFVNNTFNNVLSTEVLEHLSDPKKYLDEVIRVLVPGGNLYFTTPFFWPLHEVPHDNFRYTPYSLERLFKESGFDNIKIFPMGGWHASLAQMIGLWIRRGGIGRKVGYLYYVLTYPFIRFLINNDHPVISGNKMLTGLCGVVQKRKNV